MEFLRVERGSSPATIEAYADDLRDFLQRVMFDNGLTEWQEVTHRHVRGWLRQMSDEGKARATVRRRVAAVRSLWKFLLREQQTTTNPLALVETPRERKRLPRFMEAVEVRRLLESITGSGPADLRDRALFALIYDAGLRIGELTGLKIQDVLAGSVRVLGKGGKERIIPISSRTEAVLRDYVTTLRPRLLRDPVSDSVFLGVGGNRRPEGLDPRSVRVILRRRCKRRGWQA